MSSTGNPMLPPPTPEAAVVLLAPPPATLDDYIAAFQKTWRVRCAPANFRPTMPRRRETCQACIFARAQSDGRRTADVAIFASGDRRARLADVKVPTLVIHGDVDPLVRVEAGMDTAKTILGAKLVIVKRMGHALPEELWPEIVDAIAAHAKAHNA